MKDPFHTSLRMAKIINQADGKIEKERLQIYDLIVSAPHILKNATLPNTAKRLRKIKSENKNTYVYFESNAKLFFNQKKVQEAALRLLLGYGLISKESLRSGTVTKTESRSWQEVQNLIDYSESIDDQIIKALSEELSGTPVFGKNGVKARFKVMEYKYDSI